MAGYVVNPLFVFMGVWVLTSVLYLGGIVAGVFPRSTPALAGAVILNVGAFALGYLSWDLFGRIDGGRLAAVRTPGKPLTEERLKWSLRIALVAGGVVFFLCALRLFIISSTYGIGLLHLISDPELWRRKLVAYVGGSVHETHITTIAISLCNSVFSIGFVLLGVLLYVYDNRSRYVYVVVFLLLCIAIGILNLNRKEVMVNVLFVVFSYLVMHSVRRTRTTAEVVRGLFAPIAFLFLLFVLIDLLLDKSQTYGDRSRLTGFLFSLYWSIASPVAAFGEFVQNFNGDYLLGESLFFPVHKWLHRFGLVSQSELRIFSEKVYIPYVANVYSYLRNIYEDFGMLGIAIVPYVLGWITSVLRPRATFCLAHLNLYLILLVLITFSFYNYILISNQFYLQALVGWLFFRFDLRALQVSRA